MAKDKSKKTSDAEEEYYRPSDAPAGGDGWSLTDGTKPKSGKNDGKLFLITPLRKETVTVSRGKKSEEVEVIVADIVQINTKKPEESEEHEEVFVWAKWVQGAIRHAIGEGRVLGRLVKTDDSQSAVGYVWKLENASDEDIEAARAYRRSLDPFAVKKSGKAKTKAEPEPKGKKDKKGKSAPEPEPKKKSKKK